MKANYWKLGCGFLIALMGAACIVADYNVFGYALTFLAGAIGNDYDRDRRDDTIS